MDRFPVVLYAGAGLLGWTAGSMIMHDQMVSSLIGWGDGSALIVQAVLAAGVIAAGLLLSRRGRQQAV